MSEHFSANRFPTTHWSRVARAADPGGVDARKALSELCAAYWYPVYAFIRRRGSNPEAALDLTQDYFTRLVEKGTVAAADPQKGRFRTFLLTDCGYFLSDRREHERAAKRGGGRAVLSFELRTAENRYQREPAHGDTPERLFERAWALAVLERALDDLARHYAATGRASLFERLRPVLTAGADPAAHAESARALKMTAGALHVAVHRLRVRFGATLREQIAGTLGDPTPAEVEDEVRALFDALGG